MARGPTGPNHHGRVEKPVRDGSRQGVDNDLQRGRVRDMPVTLTVHEFGLDTQFFGFGEKVHSARGLHATAGAVRRNSVDDVRG